MNILVEVASAKSGLEAFDCLNKSLDLDEVIFTSYFKRIDEAVDMAKLSYEDSLKFGNENKIRRQKENYEKKQLLLNEFLASKKVPDSYKTVFNANNAGLVRKLLKTKQQIESQYVIRAKKLDERDEFSRKYLAEVIKLGGKKWNAGGGTTEKYFFNFYKINQIMSLNDDDFLKEDIGQSVYYDPAGYQNWRYKNLGKKDADAIIDKMDSMIKLSIKKGA